MAVLGEAVVVIRAVTDQVKGDVKKGLDDAAKEADAAGKKQGESYAENLGNSAEDDLKKDVGKKISKGLDDGYSDAKGKNDGKTAAQKFLAGFKGALGGAMPILGGAGLVTGIAGLVGGALTGIDALAGGAVALTAALSPTVSLLGVGAVSAFSAFAQGSILAGFWLKDLTSKAKNVPPAAAAARTSFQQLQATLQEIMAKVGAQTVFPALTNLFKQLSTTSLPLFNDLLTQTGQALASVINGLSAMLKNPVFSGNLKTVIDTNANSIRNFGAGGLNLVRVFTALLAAAAPVINQFTSWFAQVTGHLASVTELGNSTGKLGSFFERAAGQAKQLFDIGKNLGTALFAIGKAAFPLGSQLLNAWDAGSKGLATYVKSAEGVQTIGAYLAPNGQLAANLRALGSLFKPLFDDILKLGQNAGFEQFAIGVKEVLPGVTAALDSAETAIGKVGRALGDAFASPAGQAGIKAISTGLDDVGNSLVKLQPVIGPLLQLVGHLISSLANGLAPVFDELGKLAPGLNTSLSATGDAIGRMIAALAPALGTLVKIASDLLGAFAGPIGTVVVSAINSLTAVLNGLMVVLNPILSLVEALAPEITVLAAAFLAFKTLTGVSDKIVGIGDSLKFLGGLIGNSAGTGIRGAFTELEGAATAAAGGGLATLGRALPLIGTALVVLGALWQGSNDQIDAWTSALKAGGEQADIAQQQLKDAHDRSILDAHGIGDAWEIVKGAFADGAAQLEGYSSAQDKANSQLQAYLDKMTPVQRAQYQLTTDTAAYNDALARMQGPSQMSSYYLGKMAADQADLNQKQVQAAINAGNYSGAVSQLNAQLYGELGAQEALAGSNQAAVSAALGLAQSQKHLNDVQSDSKSSAVDVQQAQLQVQQAMSQTVTAASGAAQKYAEQAQKAGQFSKDQAGFSQALAQGYQIQVAELQKVADTIPAGPLHDAIEGAITQLEDLGHIKADPKIDAPSLSDFEKGIGEVKAGVAQVDATTGTPKVGLPDLGPFNGAVRSVLGSANDIASQHPTPVIGANPEPFNAVKAGVLASAADIANQHPTPTINANPNPFNATQSQVLSKIFGLDATTAAPTVGANSGPFNSVLGGVTGALNAIGRAAASPTVSANDRASGVIGNIQAGLNALRDKTVTVTTNYYSSGSPAGNGRMGMMATGGLVTQDQWTTVGEQGRELVFLNKGQFVATYEEANKIIAAAELSAKGAQTSTPTLMPVPAPSSSAPSGTGGYSVYAPITVHAAPGMDETTLALQIGRQMQILLRKS